jgi:hypothetical protein
MAEFQPFHFFDAPRTELPQPQPTQPQPARLQPSLTPFFGQDEVACVPATPTRPIQLINKRTPRAHGSQGSPEHASQLSQSAPATPEPFNKAKAAARAAAPRLDARPTLKPFFDLPTTPHATKDPRRSDPYLSIPNLASMPALPEQPLPPRAPSSSPGSQRVADKGRPIGVDLPNPMATRPVMSIVLPNSVASK